MRKSELILKTEIEVKEMELLNIKDQIKTINTNERELNKYFTCVRINLFAK